MQSNSYLQYPLYSLSSKAWVLIAQVGSSSEFAFFDQNLQAIPAAELGICLDLRDGVSYGHYYAVAGKIYRLPYSTTTGMLINLAQEFKPENIPPANPWASRGQENLTDKKIACEITKLSEEEIVELRRNRDALVEIKKPARDESLAASTLDLIKEKIEFSNIPCAMRDEHYKQRVIIPYFNLLLTELKQAVLDNPEIYICALKAVLLGNISDKIFAQFNLPVDKIAEILAEAWQLRFALVEDGINRLDPNTTLISQVYYYIVAVIRSEIIKYDVQKSMVNPDGKSLNFPVRAAIPASFCAIGSLPVADGVQQLITNDPSLSNDETALLHALNSFVQVDGWRSLENLSLEQLEVFLKILSICFDDNRNQNYSANDVSQAQRVLGNFIIMRRAVDYDNSQWPHTNTDPGFDHAREIELRNLKQEFEFQVSYRKHQEIHDQLGNAIRENNFTIANKILEEYVDNGIICVNGGNNLHDSPLHLACRTSTQHQNLPMIKALIQRTPMGTRRVSLSLCNEERLTALDILAKNDQLATYSELIAPTLEQDGIWMIFNSALRHADKFKNAEFLQAVTRNSLCVARLNEVDPDGFSLLHLAYDRELEPACIASLLKAGADPTLRDLAGKDIFDRIRIFHDLIVLSENIDLKFMASPRFNNFLRFCGPVSPGIENILREIFILRTLDGIEQGIVDKKEFPNLVTIAFKKLLKGPCDKLAAHNLFKSKAVALAIQALIDDAQNDNDRGAIWRAFLRACQSNRIDNIFGKNLLYVAAELGEVTIVENFLDAGVKFDPKNPALQELFRSAVSYNSCLYLSLLEKLLDSGCGNAALLRESRIPLLNVSKRRSGKTHLEIAHALLKHRDGFIVEDVYLKHELFRAAAEAGKVKLLQDLLRHNKRVEAFNQVRPSYEIDKKYQTAEILTLHDFMDDELRRMRGEEDYRRDFLADQSNRPQVERDPRAKIKLEKFKSLKAKITDSSLPYDAETLLRELAEACHYQRNPRIDTAAVVLSFGIFGLYNRYKYGTFSHQAQSWQEFKKLQIPGLEEKHREIIREIEGNGVSARTTKRVAR